MSECALTPPCVISSDASPCHHSFRIIASQIYVKACARKKNIILSQVQCLSRSKNLKMLRLMTSF